MLFHMTGDLDVASTDAKTMQTTREYNTSKPRKGVVRMDPDCAICHAPASYACECEAKGLEQAVRQAENRMMQSIYNDIRYVPFPRICQRCGQH
jgi:hypothetical protein